MEINFDDFGADLCPFPVAKLPCPNIEVVEDDYIENHIKCDNSRWVWKLNSFDPQRDVIVIIIVACMTILKLWVIFSSICRSSEHHTGGCENFKVSDSTQIFPGGMSNFCMFWNPYFWSFEVNILRIMAGSIHSRDKENNMLEINLNAGVECNKTRG